MNNRPRLQTVMGLLLWGKFRVWLVIDPSCVWVIGYEWVRCCKRSWALLCAVIRYMDEHSKGYKCGGRSLLCGNKVCTLMGTFSTFILHTWWKTWFFSSFKKLSASISPNICCFWFFFFFFFNIIFFQALLEAMLIGTFSNFSMKSFKIQSFNKCHHHEVRV
jgi:hypothetical protein